MVFLQERRAREHGSLAGADTEIRISHDTTLVPGEWPFVPLRFLAVAFGFSTDL
jgi:hypothetical protein